MGKVLETVDNTYSNIMNSLADTFTLGQIKIASLVFMIITVALIAVILYQMLYKGVQNKKKLLDARDTAMTAISSSMEKSKFKIFSYKYVDEKLKSTGMKDMFQWLNPVTWLLIEIGVAIIVFILVFPMFGIFAAILGCVLGVLIPNYVAEASNKQDNRKILEDLRAVYDIFRIQSRAGAYTSLILSDCYMMVCNKRLRNGFKQLIADITIDKGMEKALEDFRSKFSNEYIDSLVLVIKQSLVTGTTVQMLDDIKAQIDNLEGALIIAEKENAETRIVVVQLMLYVAIIAVSAFIALTAILENLSFIN